MTQEIFRVVDTETTGMEADDRVVELGWTDLYRDGRGRIQLVGPHEILVDPGRPIPPEASAVHHLTDPDVRGAATLDQAIAGMMGGASPVPVAIVAHNAGFDRGFLPQLAGPWICTWKAACAAWPEAPGHSNQVLRYWLGLDLPEEYTLPAHRAGPDTYVTAALLIHLLERFTLEELVAIAERPVLLSRVTFGKHRGERWADLPAGYLRWVINAPDMDENRVHTARYWLDRR